LRSIAGGCRADFDRHGRALSKVENAILSPRAALVTFEMMEGAFVANVDSLSNLSRNTLSVAAAEPARLRSAAKQSSNHNLRCVRQTASAGFTTAAQPNAASQARQLLRIAFTV
jgi:hypothetical protein